MRTRSASPPTTMPAWRITTPMPVRWPPAATPRPDCTATLSRQWTVAWVGLVDHDVAARHAVEAESNFMINGSVGEGLGQVGAARRCGSAPAALLSRTPEREDEHSHGDHCRRYPGTPGSEHDGRDRPADPHD